MFIKPTKKAEGSIFDINEDIMTEALLYPANEEVPCPWDAEILVEGNKVIILGGLGSGGIRGAKCRCECSIEDFTRFYKLEIPEHMNGFKEAVEDLEMAGWIEA